MEDSNQYKTMESLWKAIEKEWNKIPLKIIKNVISTMNSRLIDILEDILPNCCYPKKNSK